MKGKRWKLGVLSGFLILAALLAWQSTARAAGRLFADMVILNGNVLTINDKNPRAEAIAVKGDKIVAVGSTRGMEGLIGENTKVIDAKGKTVIPGFVDAHLHPEPIFGYNSLQYNLNVGPDNVKNMDELVASLKKKAMITPKGEWVIGSRYDEVKLGRHPNRYDLDKASIEHPIWIGHVSGHIAACNTMALKDAKITKTTPDPEGGTYEKDKNGELTGVLWEKAGRWVRMKGHPIPAPTVEETNEGVTNLFNKFLSKGITSVGDAAGSIEEIKKFSDAMKAGRNTVRVYGLMRNKDPRYPEPFPLLNKLNMGTGFGNEWLKIGPMKIVQGSAYSGRTALLYEPYDMINPATGKKDYYGLPLQVSQEDMDKWVMEVHKAGYQICIHSNGDLEIDQVLNSYEKALKAYPRENHRHRIEHCAVTTPKILERIKKLGVVPVIFSYSYEHGDKIASYGEWRQDDMCAFRSSIDMGIPVASHSDYGVSAADPLLRMYSMVTRKSKEGKVYGPKQAITAMEALKIWTIGNAFAQFEENIKGSIEVGKLADIAILSDDPTKVPSEAIKDIKVEKTIVGGNVQYERM
jgi:predicted amidohydrolase YtcJ